MMSAARLADRLTYLIVLFALAYVVYSLHQAGVLRLMINDSLQSVTLTLVYVVLTFLFKIGQETINMMGQHIASSCLAGCITRDSELPIYVNHTCMMDCFKYENNLN